MPRFLPPAAASASETANREEPSPLVREQADLADASAAQQAFLLESCLQCGSRKTRLPRAQSSPLSDVPWNENALSRAGWASYRNNQRGRTPYNALGAATTLPKRDIQHSHRRSAGLPDSLPVVRTSYSSLRLRFRGFAFKPTHRS